MAMNPEILRLLLMQQGLGGSMGGKGGGTTQGLGSPTMNATGGGAQAAMAQAMGGAGGAPGAKQGLLSRFQDWVGNRLVPQGLPGTEGLSPEQQAAIRRQAVSNYGMGLIGGAASGRGLGRNLAGAAMGAQQGLADSLDRYAANAERQYRHGRDTMMDQRYDAAQTYQQGRDKVTDERNAKLDSDTAKFRAQQLGIDMAQLRLQQQQANDRSADAVRQRERNDRMIELLGKGGDLTDKEWRELQFLSGNGLPSTAFGGIALGGLGGNGMANVPMWDPATGRFQ